MCCHASSLVIVLSTDVAMVRLVWNGTMGKKVDLKMQSIRKALAFLLILLVWVVFPEASAESGVSAEVGEIFTLGQYDQNSNSEDGLEPIEWLMLSKEDDKALLLSLNTLDYQSYNSSGGNTTWRDASLRAWLNDDFLSNAFCESEKAAILSSEVVNSMEENNPEWQIEAGENTRDKVFLLSVAEANRYFGNNDERKNRGSETARALGARVWPFEETDWWLRSPGRVEYDASFVGTDGAYYSNAVTNKKGIRPALWLDLKAPQDDFLASRYQTAYKLFDKQQYEEAAATFKVLGSYSKSASLVLQSKYAQARQAADNREYAFAITIFESLGDYSDSYDQARECRYAQALAVQESGALEEAAKLFGRLGQYKDSMSRLKECFHGLGISIYYASETAVNAGTNTGYSKSDKIVVTDAHFGWRLGRFMMSGFTRTVDDATGKPIFLKTLGDKVTLWFDLEQDIAHLNDSDNLSIAEDLDGYDEYFGVRKTNFGHGVLIVRHRDYQNSVSDPVIYTDFLAAKESYGADTKVELFEEGDYEVTLNYETVSKSVAILNNYANYSIRFAFSVRNGNVMVFPFDVVTGAELTNSSVTENGFYLDLAKSRYLDINIKRSVLTEGASGIVEDQRFNRPAKDGDRYTQEGIYTISVHNRYTGEQTEKQLFVGTEELLNKYLAKGFVLEEPKK